MKKTETRILADMPIDPDALDGLKARPDTDIRLVEREGDRRDVRCQPVDLINDRNILFCRKPPENLSEMKDLEFIQINSVGYAQLYGLDLVDRGIIMAGGGSLLRGLDDLIAKDTGLPVTVADDPLFCVVKGAGKVLDELDFFKDALMK